MYCAPAGILVRDGIQIASAKKIHLPMQEKIYFITAIHDYLPARSIQSLRRASIVVLRSDSNRKLANADKLLKGNAKLVTEYMKKPRMICGICIATCFSSRLTNTNWT